jgi:hydrogenase maturation protease
VRYLIGIGNYYGLDDSIGLRIAETIGERGLDRGFRAIDLGGNLLDLVHYLGADTEQVLIVDAARMGREPGEYEFFVPADVTTRKRSAGMSTHEGDLMKVIEFAESMGAPVEHVTIMGIEPALLGNEPGLSPLLQSRFEDYVGAALEFLGDKRV